MKGDRSRQVSPNHQNYTSEGADNRRSSLPSQLGAGGGESGFESASSAFLFGRRLVGAGFGGVAGGAASSPSSVASARRQPPLQPPQQRQRFYQQNKSGDVAAAAWDSGSQEGSGRVGRGGGRYSTQPSPLLADRRPATGVLGAADGAARTAFSLRTDSESESVLGGRGMGGADLRRREGRGAAAAAAAAAGPPTVEARVVMGGGSMVGPTTLFSGAVGRVMERPLLTQVGGETSRGRSSALSSSTSSSGYESSGYGGRRRRERSDRSSGSSDDDDVDDVRGDSSSESRGRPPLSRTKTKTIPPSMGAFGGEISASRRARRHGSVSSGNSSTSDDNSSRSSGSRSSSSSGRRISDEAWSVASGGRWRGPAWTREPRSARENPAAGMHAAGWGGGGGSSVGASSVTFGSGSGSIVDEGGVGGYPVVSNGTVGGRGTAGSLRRRRFGQEG